MQMSAPTQSGKADPDVIPVRIENVHQPERIWSECLNLIRGRVNNQNFKAWFEPIKPVRMIDGKFVIQIPSQFFCDWLDEHHYSLLTEVLTKVTGVGVVVDYEVVSEERDSDPVGHVPSSYSPEAPGPISSEPP